MDGLVRDHHDASPGQVLLGPVGQTAEDARLDVYRVTPESVGDDDDRVHYQVTSVVPARWLARRARVKRRSESRFR